MASISPAASPVSSPIGRVVLPPRLNFSPVTKRKAPDDSIPTSISTPNQRTSQGSLTPRKQRDFTNVESISTQKRNTSIVSKTAPKTKKPRLVPSSKQIPETQQITEWDSWVPRISTSPVPPPICSSPDEEYREQSPSNNVTVRRRRTNVCCFLKLK